MIPNVMPALLQCYLKIVLYVKIFQKPILRLIEKFEQQVAAKQRMKMRSLQSREIGKSSS